MKTFTAKFKNLQKAFQALAAEDAIIFCDNINMDYHFYHEDSLLKITVEETGNLVDDYNEVIVTTQIKNK